jgi:hypothetical protein
MDDLSASPKPRLRLLLDHFSKIEDTRQVRHMQPPLAIGSARSARTTTVRPPQPLTTPKARLRLRSLP